MKIKLIGKSPSINVRKVLWTAVELGLDLEREEQPDLASPAFRAINPNALVPVLIDGEFALWESNTICRYLVNREQRWDLLPAEPQQRARVEQWMDWQAGELNNSWRYAFLSLVRQSPAHQDPTLLATGIAGWHKHIGILAQRLEATGAYVAGEQFTLADVLLGLSAHRWRAAPLPDRPDLPAIDRYVERLSERPGFVRFGLNGGA
ncbi:glutathione S-transferase N-terminal domain-containing protein [Paucibacter sp. R3-3]|uniref:Glutathione S-transferase N-terminal domain-containing protein n=1 Tax=Roseateles agri TaxID=3098619 RepID=A0ABU5DFG1_9BURK|nr:glutathione S-transferase N-terminal domain-containing protein [Paucibacter sp. R3-3]MDY0745012.1 glutathione S-transferase N-terminal domain-containing protein [Paucibacter sp. R3-3]